ncbi:hypothetical protein P9272_35950, partial [Mesorhizobium sp. WSM4976]|uniref:hypothetical protein n=1 Tax=Mesorhizobium sp. WSM4976 TaxID=3038549 RepID=UPI002415ABB6
TLHLGTDDQKPDPDIEADRGAGQVPAWPGIVYVVIKNLPLDEFGIRVPNIEAELLKGAVLATASIDGFAVSRGEYNNDTNGSYLASENGGTLSINAMPAGTTIFAGTVPYSGSVHISDRLDVAVLGSAGTSIGFYDAATGSFRQEIAGLGGSIGANAILDDISFGGVTYMLV